MCTAATLLYCGTSEFLKDEVVVPHARCHVFFFNDCKSVQFSYAAEFQNEHDGMC